MASRAQVCERLKVRFTGPATFYLLRNQHAPLISSSALNSPLLPSRRESTIEMITDRKLASNRANAKKSTGPRTAEGKRISALNAMKHGLHASEFRIDTETEESYNNYRYQLLLDYGPQSATELILVEQLLHAFLLSRRMVAYLPDIHEGASRGGPAKVTAYPAILKAIYQLNRTVAKSIEQLQQIKADRLSQPEEVEQDEPLLNLPDPPDLNDLSSGGFVPDISNKPSPDTR